MVMYTLLLLYSVMVGEGEGEYNVLDQVMVVYSSLLARSSLDTRSAPRTKIY